MEGDASALTAIPVIGEDDLMPRKAKNKSKSGPATNGAAPAAKASGQSRSAFIRSLPVDMKAADVVKKGAGAGLTFRTNLVYEVRRSMKAKTGASRGPGRPPKAAGAHTSHVGHAPKLGGGSSQEQHLIGIVLEIGMRRAGQILDQLRSFGK